MSNNLLCERFHLFIFFTGLDFFPITVYNTPNFIGQFATIPSVNKTREFWMGIVCPFFVGMGALCTFFEGGLSMPSRSRQIAQAGIIAALYVALTHMQNILLPGSATWAIQFRASEALCVLAFFTPAAIWGLAIGCLVFNITFAAALPLDFLVGSLATLLATFAMWHGRNLTVKGYPLPGMLMPGIFNALLVGWELTVYIGGGFFINALYVFIGEAAVLLTLGSTLYRTMKRRGLYLRLFL